jgi:hypothetical protein
MTKAAQQSKNWKGGNGAVFQAVFPGLARRDRLESSFFNSQTESASRPPASILQRAFGRVPWECTKDKPLSPMRASGQANVKEKPQPRHKPCGASPLGAR